MTLTEPCNVRPPPMPFTLPWPLPRVPVMVPKADEVGLLLLGRPNCGVLLNWKASKRISDAKSR